MPKIISIIQSSINYLNSSKEDEILQVDFLKTIAKITNKTTESVRGTVMGTASYKIFENKKINKTWCFARNPARFVRKGSKYEKDIYKFSYNTTEKIKARKRILSYIPKKSNPTILTLASSEGYCVRDILSKHKKAKIYNVEQYKHILAKWTKKDIPTRNYLCQLSKFLISEDFKNENFDFVNFDLMGYASKKTNKIFTIINKSKNCKYIAITLQYLPNSFRNSGPFAEWLRSEYGGKDEATLQWIKDVFYNYTLDDVFVYNRDNKNRGRAMQVFIFKENK